MNSTLVLLVAAIGLGTDLGGESNQTATVDSTKYWSNFRGPLFNGSSPTATPPLRWGNDSGIKWRTAVPGKGSASPIVWADKVFVATAVNLESGENDNAAPEPPARRRSRRPMQLAKHQFLAVCYDRETGSEIWKRVAFEGTPRSGHHPDASYASASPVTDGKFVYFNFGSIGLFCFDLDGKLIWQRDDLGQMQTRGGFGEGSSVVISGENLILPWDHEGQSRIEVINKANGKTVWSKERDEPSNWATPMVVTVAGRQQIIHAGQNYSRGYDLESGEEIWRSSGLSQRPVASPVVFKNNGIFASSRRGAALNAYPLDKNGDISSKPTWKINRQAPDCPSLLLSEHRLYFLSGNRALLSCADANSGDLFFGPERLEGLNGVYSSPVGANGHVFITSRDGKTAVIKDQQKFDLIAVNDVAEPIDATLALVGNQIFIRGRKHLFCIEK